MSEKVLGFYEKDSDKFEERLNFPTEITIDENKLVPVRLASESVDLKKLEKIIKELEEIKNKSVVGKLTPELDRSFLGGYSRCIMDLKRKIK